MNGSVENLIWIIDKKYKKWKVVKRIKFDKLIENETVLLKKQTYEDGIDIYKLGNDKKVNVVIISGISNAFKIDRDLFYYLSNQNENYSFLLFNKLDNDMFYLEFKSKINWLNSSFERSDKKELYFGKIILQHRVTIKEFCDKIRKY